MIELDILRSLFHYDQETGVITWAKTLNSRAITGQRAGVVDKATGRRKITIFGKQYYAYRLAWFYSYGTWPERIDHINRDPSDDRLENLRAANAQQNACNSTYSRGGVARGIRIRGSGRYQPHVAVKGKRFYLGTFATIEEAIAARTRALEALHGKFAPTINQP